MQSLLNYLSDFIGTDTRLFLICISFSLVLGLFLSFLCGGSD